MSEQFFHSLNQTIEHGSSQKILHHSVQDTSLNGQCITIEGKKLVNFGSCSYLGLEQHESLKNAVIEAVKNYGSQFSSSRTYASLALYDKLEGKLAQMYQKPVIVTASTTLGHLATIPTVIEDSDALILDMQVHNSVQMAVKLVKANGNTVEIIRHNDMEALEQKIKRLGAKNKKVWYFADGVYSMYGDFAPLKKLVDLLDKYTCFHLYIDDAHGCSWAGPHGVGYVLSQIDHHPKMILTGSLNKSFAAAGGIVVFPNQKMEKKVRNCGGTLIFCGPIQPPMLGAALASVQLHLSEDIIAFQQSLREKIEYTNQLISELGLPQFAKTSSPLFFIPVGLNPISVQILRRLKTDGFYANAGSFPATPIKRGGIRFMINNHLDFSDIKNMLHSLAKHYAAAVYNHGSSFSQVAKTFRIPKFQLKCLPSSIKQSTKEQHDLAVEKYESIHHIPVNDWDEVMGNRGNFTHASLQMLESVFSNKKQPENNWSFYYFRVRDQSGQLILSTFFTCTLVKDDMFAPAETSQQIEQIRLNKPAYLVSKSVATGSPITKGNHLYINQLHPEWKTALSILIEEMQKVVEKEDAAQLMLRDFRKGANKELKAFLMEKGLVELNLPNECLMQDLSWNSQDEYLARLGGKYRYNVRKEILAYQKYFDVRTDQPDTEEQMKDCYELYLQVFARSFELNVHQLPFSYFQNTCIHQDFDIIRLYLKNEQPDNKPQKPIAVMISHYTQQNYHAMIIGLDYKFLSSHKTYKQMLYLTTLRAKALNCQHLDLAFTAELEKKKIGARPFPVCAYVQAVDHFNHAVIESFN